MHSTSRVTALPRISAFAGIAFFFMAACTSANQGVPMPQTPFSTSAPSGDHSPTTSEMNTQKSLNDLDMCELLTPADLPIQAGEGGKTKHELKDAGSACEVAVQMSDIFSIIVVKVSREPIKFSRYNPPAGSPNGKFTEIGNRKAWVGNPVASASDKHCFTAFGSADGYIALTITDETERGVDPCVTATGLAEKVIPRTPEPYDQ